MKFKFSGIIDCNTEVELDNLSYQECKGIEKFIEALDKDTYISWVEADIETIKSDKDYEGFKVGDKIWLTKQPENIFPMAGRFKKFNLNTPIEKKIHQIVIDSNGIKYQVNGGHITPDMLGQIAFLNYEDALKNMDNEYKPPTIRK
jgi:hypothetical protein